jgi:flagellar FliJ protein
MAGFHYKMQSILDIKYKLETQAKTAFAVAAQALAAEEEILQGLKDRQADYEELNRQLCCQKLDIPRINQCHEAIDTMKELIKRQQVSVHLAQRNLESARANLNAVMKERKTHEKLKENALDEFKQEMEMAESKEIDQLVSYSYQAKTI